MLDNINTPEYGLDYSDLPPHATYVWRPVLEILGSVQNANTTLDVGCGTGRFAYEMSKLGYEAYGIDASMVRLEHGEERFKTIRLRQYSVYDDYREAFENTDCFDAIISLEVVEHLYSPEAFVTRIAQALVPGGVVILSTPYHGYLKNLALAASGQFDRHFTALWEGGHIKFWSKATLVRLLEKHGFERVEFRGVGRFPWLWKSMIVWGYKAYPYTQL